MKNDARDIPGLERNGGAGVAARGKGVRDTPAAAASDNWAWAHRSDSYDWMDSAGPLPIDDLAG
jgi:hypothetical protein